ncbi:MAG TPA: hypothetical protein VK642_05450, partial [Burkholderiales bacterium]|nr:hypothetical protein [Burkholderiales bacterium]
MSLPRLVIFKFAVQYRGDARIALQLAWRIHKILFKNKYLYSLSRRGFRPQAHACRLCAKKSLLGPCETTAVNITPEGL